jgi:hypothetical protein
MRAAASAGCSAQALGAACQSAHAAAHSCRPTPFTQAYKHLAYKHHGPDAASAAQFIPSGWEVGRAGGAHMPAADPGQNAQIGKVGDWETLGGCRGRVRTKASHLRRRHLQAQGKEAVTVRWLAVQARVSSTWHAQGCNRYLPCCSRPCTAARAAAVSAKPASPGFSVFRVLNR